MDNVFMSQDLYNWISSAPDNACFILIFAGFFTCMIYNLIFSFADYLNYKAWRVNDLEKIIGKNLKVYDVDSNFEKKIVAECNENYSKYLFNKERRNKFFDKLKSFFKR